MIAIVSHLLFAQVFLEAGRGADDTGEGKGDKISEPGMLGIGKENRGFSEQSAGMGSKFTDSTQEVRFKGSGQLIKIKLPYHQFPGELTGCHTLCRKN